MVVGHFAHVLAIVEGIDQDETFTAGLVHNIGRLAFVQHRPDDLRAATTEARATRSTIHDVQQRLHGFTDAELGAAIADS